MDFNKGTALVGAFSGHCDTILCNGSLTVPVVAGEEVGLARGQPGPRHGAGLAVEAVVQDGVVVPAVRRPLLRLLVIGGTSPALGVVL